MEQKIGTFGANQTWSRGVKTPTTLDQTRTLRLRSQTGSLEAEGSWWLSRDRKERGAEMHSHLEEVVPGDTDTVVSTEETLDTVTRQGEQLNEAPQSNTEALGWEESA